jgi:molybdate transport system substrate-binding protein
MAAEIKVLSAGAVKTGLLRAADEFKRASGHEVKVQFNTAPQIAKKLAEGEAADILIAPPTVLDEQARNNKVSAQGRIVLGRVGAGVVVRTSAPNPDIATTEALKRAMLGADSIAYNTASTGLFLEKLFERIGVADEIKPKTSRYPDGEGVMLHVINGRGNDLGFGATTEIKVFESKGAKLAGPLPADIQNYTSYGAALLTSAAAADAATAFLAYLATPEGKQIFVAAGVE